MAREIFPDLVRVLQMALNVRLAGNEPIFHRELIPNEQHVSLPVHPLVDRLILSPLHLEASSMLLVSFKGIQLVHSINRRLSMSSSQQSSKHTAASGSQSPLLSSIHRRQASTASYSTASISSSLEKFHVH